MILRDCLRRASNIAFDPVAGITEKNVQAAINKVQDLANTTSAKVATLIDTKTADNRYIKSSEYVPWRILSADKVLTSGIKYLVWLDDPDTNIVLTLPDSPVAGESLIVADGTGLAGHGKSITIKANNTKIMSADDDIDFDISGSMIRMVYVNASRGWVILK